ncbi:hypothetical protein GOD01_17530 [Sinorhizobium medicae]|nr:hypothetical protein [Sinorhizobium medicae]
MTLIAQAYIHDKNIPSPSELEEWGIIAQMIAYEEASRVYGPKVEIEISFEIGSLKTRVQVFLGACLAVYGFVATYPDFKEGLNQMVQDARDFAGSFNEEFISKAGIESEDIVSRQRKIETPGRILRVLESLEEYERRGRNALRDELPRILEQLARALADLEPQDQKIVVELLQKRFPNLPLPLRLTTSSHTIWRPEDGNEIFQMMEEEETEKDYIARLSTNRPLRSQLRLTWQGRKDD